MPGYWDLWALWGKGKQERTESLGNTVRPWPGPHWLVVQKPTALGFRARPYLLFLSRATRVVIPSLQFPDLQLSGSPSALSPPSSLPSWSSSGTSSGWVRCGRESTGSKTASPPRPTCAPWRKNFKAWSAVPLTFNSYATRGRGWSARMSDFLLTQPFWEGRAEAWA